MEAVNAGLYIHVPFCSKKCPYCHFYKQLWNKEAETDYVESLVCEIKAYHDRFGKLQVPTIFFGGGTPNVLRTASLELIYKVLDQYFDLSNCQEQTMEINPGLSSVNKLKDIKALGINRISVGTQSFNDAELKFLGRQHTAEQNKRCVDSIYDAGFKNFSLDIIYGLPNSTVDDLESTIQTTLSLKPNHISTYALSIEPDTPFKRRGIQAADDDVELQQYELIQNAAKNAGYIHYEISNFTKAKHQCQHNLRYWDCEAVIGLGPGAHSFFQNARYKNARSLKNYIQNPVPRAFQLNKWPVQSKKIQMENDLICQLRQIKPLDLQRFNQKYKIRFKDEYQAELDQLMALNLVAVTKNQLELSPKGRELLNSVIEILLR